MDAEREVTNLKNEKTQCIGCQNEFVELTGRVDSEPHCPFCQLPIGRDSPQDMLEKMTGLTLLGTAKLQASAKVYVVQRRNEKFLMTLLEEDSTIYSMWKHARDEGRPDPYQAM